jgi:tRNA(fMet)-specific endonuclease VapC
MKTTPDQIKISMIVYAELLFGVEKSLKKDENLLKLRGFLKPFELIPFGARASETYASIRARCVSRGETVGPNDLLIAATVIAENGTLVTRNTLEFSRIDGLNLVSW